MLAALLSAAASGCAASVTRREADLAAQLAVLQSRYGGRLGVYVLDTGSRRAFGLNEQDRFAMCSTFKLLLAAASELPARELEQAHAQIGRLLAQS
jgi:beta-lactamase class A